MRVKIAAIFSKHRLGLTLVELLVTMVILSIVMGLTLTLFFNIQRTQKKLDAKYTTGAEADRVIKKMENSLRGAQKLLAGTAKSIQFLDSNGDTIKYALQGDTLYNNEKILTDLPVDSAFFAYIKYQADQRIADFHLFDLDLNRILDTTELKGMSGMDIYLDFLSSRGPVSRKVALEKRLVISFRSLQSQ